jgi:uncharacterized protein with ATP-grasp and redox domains
MQTSAECIPCFLRQTAEALELGGVPLERHEMVLRRVLEMLSKADWSASPPEISQALHRIIRKESGSADPYRSLKDRMNALAMTALPTCLDLITAAADPLEAVVRIAVAGNLLDAGAKVQIQPEQLPGLLAELWNKPMVGDPHALFRAAAEARHILYLADNAGEIVFDRLLIEALPHHKMTVAVRGRPILNDALHEDATLAGIAALTQVINNGSDAPGTVLADCSEEFLGHFRCADLIISKGQGNYETLSRVDAPIFFLFTVKCPLVATQIGCPAGTLVAQRSSAAASRAQGDSSTHPQAHEYTA